MSDRTPPFGYYGMPDFGSPPFNWRPVIIFAIVLFIAAVILGN